MNIIESAHAYERWLSAQLKRDVIADDLVRKHDKMAANPFQFLRATYWRWAETIFDACPELKKVPVVLAIGDIHVENFGTWRDAEGRLVWGVNDFDEAAKMPYALDIVRLAASAKLAKVPGISAPAICASILKGYREGIANPGPYVLDRKYKWLRTVVVVTDKQRKKFWDKFDPLKAKKKAAKKGAKPRAGKIRGRYVKALDAARPGGDVAFVYQPRTAGTGSLGRPRWVGTGEWQGEAIVREAKAMVRSGWARVHHGGRRLRCEEIATGKHRCPDPWYRLHGRVLVRRLSPNDYKIEAVPKKKSKANGENKSVTTAVLVNAKMLRAMGRDLASIHRGTPNRKKVIMADLARRKPGWLLEAVTAASAAIEAEWGEWRDHWAARQKGAKRPGT